MVVKVIQLYQVIPCYTNLANELEHHLVGLNPWRYR